MLVSEARSKVHIDTRLDAGETGCGELTLLIFQTIQRLAPGQTIEVLAYDLAAGVDIPAWCRSTGHTLLEHDASVRPQRFIIRKETGQSNLQ